MRIRKSAVAVEVPTTNRIPKQDFKSTTFLHDTKVGTILLPSIILLLLVGGQTTIGILSFCFLLLYVSDLLQLTVAGVISTILLHVCVAIGICRACLPLISHSYWNLCILGLVSIIAIGSTSWSVLHFHALRRSNAATLKGLERMLIVATPPACVGIVAWGCLSFFGPEHAPWITMVFVCVSNYLLSDINLVSSFVARSRTKTNSDQEQEEEQQQEQETRTIHTKTTYYLSKCNILLPALFHWGLHHNVLPPFHVRAIRSVILCDQITIFLIPLLLVLLHGGEGFTKIKNKHNQKQIQSSNKSFTKLIMSSIVIGCILVVYWFRHRSVLMHHRKSALRLLGVTQPWDTVIVLGVPTSISILIIQHLIHARTTTMLPCILLLSTSFLTCVGTTWIPALILSSMISYASAQVYGLIRGDEWNSNASNSQKNSFDFDFDIDMNFNSSHHRNRSSRRKKMILYYVVAMLCTTMGWMHGTWNTYGSLTGAGFVWEADIPLLGGIEGNTFKQPVRMTSLIAVGLNAVLFVLLPLLLSVDIGTKRTSKIAGKLFVLHSAGTIVSECLLIPHVHGTVGHNGLSTSIVHVLLTSFCGLCIAWCLSHGKKYWFHRVPVQDSWMAGCIYLSKLATLLPKKTSVEEDVNMKGVGAALGTFCILATLTAPFVWYDPPEKDNINGQKNRSSNNSSNSNKSSNNGIMTGIDTKKDRDTNSMKRQKVYLTSWILTTVHILVGAAGVLVYRTILILEVFPFLNSITGGYLFNIINIGKDDVGRRTWLKTSTAVGIQMILLGCWICGILVRHFPKDIGPKRVSLFFAIFGLILCIFSPSFDLISVWLSIIIDIGAFKYIQKFTNPWTGNAFYADKIGILNSATMNTLNTMKSGSSSSSISLNKSVDINSIKGLWKPWVLFIIVLVLMNKMSDWMEALVARNSTRKSSLSRRRQSTNGKSKAFSVVSLRLLSKDIVNYQSVFTNIVLGVLSTCWSLSASVSSVQSNTAIGNGGFTFNLLEFIATSLLVTLFFTIFERLLVLPVSSVLSTRILPMYAVILALLMFHIGLVEMNALLDPDMYVRDNVHPLSASLAKMVGKVVRHGQHKKLEDGIHEIERLMSLHGMFHLLLAILVRFKYDDTLPFVRNNNNSNNNTSNNTRATNKNSSSVESVSERMRSLGLDSTTSLRSRRNSSQHSTITKVLNGQKILQVLGTTSTVVCTLAVGIVCLTRSVGKYQSIVLSAFIMILVPRSTSTREVISKKVATFTAILLYVTCALDVEVVAFDVFGLLLGTSNGSSLGGDNTSWWWIPTLNALTLLGTIPLQKTVIKALWNGGVGGRAGVSGLILPMPLAVVCILVSKSDSVFYAFCLSSIVWFYLVYGKWK